MDSLFKLILLITAYTFLLLGSALVWTGIILILPYIASAFSGGFFFTVKRWLPMSLLLKQYTNNPALKEAIECFLSLYAPVTGLASYGFLLYPYFIFGMTVLVILLDMALVLHFGSIALFGSKGLWSMFYGPDPVEIPPIVSDSTKPTAECTPPPSPPKPSVPVKSSLDSTDYTVVVLIGCCLGVFVVTFINLFGK
jgi:hypothetical protein